MPPYYLKAVSLFGFQCGEGKQSSHSKDRGGCESLRLPGYSYGSAGNHTFFQWPPPTLYPSLWALIYIFWPSRVACGILVPWTENKLVPLLWKCGALTTGLPENFLIIGSYNLVCSPFLNGQQEVSLAWRWLVWPLTALEARCSNNTGTCKRKQRWRQWFPESRKIFFFFNRERHDPSHWFIKSPRLEVGSLRAFVFLCDLIKALH